MKLATGIALIVCAALGAGCDQIGAGPKCLNPQPLPPCNAATSSSGSLASSGTSAPAGAASGTLGSDVDAAGLTGPSGSAAPVSAADAGGPTAVDGSFPEIVDASSDSMSFPADAGLDAADADHADVLEDAADAADAGLE
jgi:hypothetical protein